MKTRLTCRRLVENLGSRSSPTADRCTIARSDVIFFLLPTRERWYDSHKLLKALETFLE